MSTDVAAAPVDAQTGVKRGPADGVASEAAATRETAAFKKEAASSAKLAPTPTFLHSPPDSNNAAKSDASDSELSDLDDDILLDSPRLAAVASITLPLPPPPLPPQSPPSKQQQETEEKEKEGEQGQQQQQIRLPQTDQEINDEPQQKKDQSEKVDENDGIPETLPDHWSGAVPVFRPTMEQFEDFQRFMKSVDKYGMKSGIIKVIPPQEWKDAQPPLDNLVKLIKVREPIKQDIMGSNGTYRQVNFLHGRSYNLPQWRQLCEQSEHQPPAKRGERRINADRPKPPRTRATASKTDNPSTPSKRGKTRSAKIHGKQAQDEDEERPMTPISPKSEPQNVNDNPVDSVEKDASSHAESSESQASRLAKSAKPSKPKTQSVSARRKFSRREGSAMIDEVAFKNFDYRMESSEYTSERCEELERSYWKMLTYAPPLYGADMMGTLFDDRTKIWNLNKLPNLLDVLGTKVPGVNTAYLYLGMWKATFAWHLEDVDLYSINYLHFGAPKQWYSISQADARRFEAAMKSVWPVDAKACDQFLRHKGFLISPHHLLQNYGIKVNRVVSYPGEFVVTYPYGYHSGYNMGYNCAEAVNFALDSWLEMGKIAKKCECAQAQDSVWVDVYEIERKLRGEETEYEETEDEDDEEDEEMSGLPTPPASHSVRFKEGSRKRQRGPTSGGKVKVKRIKLRLKAKADPPCCLCPHDIPNLELLPTEDNRKAHRLCALYVPETYIDTIDDGEIICNIKGIPKDRFDLKCLLCRSKRGACFQCSQKKCARAYHATCAAAAGCFIEDQEVPVYGEDGTEFKEQAFEFSCRFHRSKRDKKITAEALETDDRVLSAARALIKGEICQFQYMKGEIFAGIMVENRPDEHTVVIDILPRGDRMEVEWKWLLLPDPSDYHLPKASPRAIPMPASQKVKDLLNAKRPCDDTPRKDDFFVDGYHWAEFALAPATNQDQAKIDLNKPDQIWYYLGGTSTEARAQYTEDPQLQRHNPRANFLETLPKPPKPPKPAASSLKPTACPLRRSSGHSTGGYPYLPGSAPSSTSASTGVEKPYVYKPRKPIGTQAGVAANPGSSCDARPPQALNRTGGPQHPFYDLISPRFEPIMSHPSTASSVNEGNARPDAQVASAQVPRNFQRPSSVALSTSKRSNQSRASWQVHSSVYLKYPFFQVDRNRELTSYKTPYSPWGGFTNGYQGDLMAHILSKTRSTWYREGHLTTAKPPPEELKPAKQALPQLLPKSNPATVSASQTSATQQDVSPCPNPGSTPNCLHDATLDQLELIRQQPLQASQVIPKSEVVGAKTNPTPKAFKVGMPAVVNLALKMTKPATQVPLKQSPVPLPANFLAAMSPSQSSRAASAMSRSSTPISINNHDGSSGSQHDNASSAKQTVQEPLLPSVAVIAEQEEPAQSLDASTTVLPSSSGCPPKNTASSTVVPAQNALVTTPTYSPLSDAGLAGPSTHIPEIPNLAQDEVPSIPSVSCANDARQQEFPDVPGRESMEFMERMMENLKRASRRLSASQQYPGC